MLPSQSADWWVPTMLCSSPSYRPLSLQSTERIIKKLLRYKEGANRLPLMITRLAELFYHTLCGLSKQDRLMNITFLSLSCYLYYKWANLKIAQKQEPLRLANARHLPFRGGRKRFKSLPFRGGGTKCRRGLCDLTKALEICSFIDC